MCEKLCRIARQVVCFCLMFALLVTDLHTDTLYVHAGIIQVSATSITQSKVKTPPVGYKIIKKAVKYQESSPYVFRPKSYPLARLTTSGTCYECGKSNVALYEGIMCFYIQGQWTAQGMLNAQQYNFIPDVEYKLVDKNDVNKGFITLNPWGTDNYTGDFVVDFYDSTAFANLQGICYSCLTKSSSDISSLKKSKTNLLQGQIIVPISYTIRYNKNSSTATGSMKDSTFHYQGNATGALDNYYALDKYTLSKNTFTNGNRQFLGWNTKADGSGTFYSDEQVVRNLTTEDNKVIDLYAQWGSKITLNANGGQLNSIVGLLAQPNKCWSSIDSDNNRTVLKQANGSYFTKNFKVDNVIPQRLDYKFLGFYTEANGGSQIIDENGILLQDYNFFTSNTTLYAHWEKLKFNIYLNANGGNISSISHLITKRYSYWGYIYDNDEYAYTDTSGNYVKKDFTDPNVKPSRTDYTFKGYYTAQTDGIQIIDANGKFLQDYNYFHVDTTLYARWEKSYCKITLDPNGGTAGSRSVLVSKKNDYWAFLSNGTQYKYLASDGSNAKKDIFDINLRPNRTNYLFTGFYTEKNGNGTQIINARGQILVDYNYFTDDTTLYANWENNNQDATTGIRFAAEGGTIRTSGTGQRDYLIVGTLNGAESFGFFYTWINPNTGKQHYWSDEDDYLNFTVPAPVGLTATRPGYKFGGFYTEQNGKGERFSDGNGVIYWSPSDWRHTYYGVYTTLYAYWTPKTDTKYKVNHYLQNAYDDNYTLKESQQLSGTTNTKVTPATKTYDGFTSPEKQTIIIKGDGTSEVNYYYTRNSNKLKVVGLLDGMYFDDLQNYGTYDMYVDNVKTDTTVTKFDKWIKYNGVYSIKNITAKAGYSYKGVVAGSLEATMKNDDILVRLSFTKNVYNISYNLNSGSVSGTNPTTYTVTSNTITLINPTRQNYVFLGWTGSNGTTPQKTVTIPKGSTGNKSYVANWKAKPYTITYDGNGGTLNSNNPTSFTPEDTFTLLNPTRTGYDFIGWTGSNGATPQITVTIPKGTTENKSYKANWKVKTYTITYDGNAGILNSSNPTSYTVETNTFALLNPTRNGYDFIGWTGSNGTTPQTTVKIQKGTTGNKTYKANWKVKTYTITYVANGGILNSNNKISYTVADVFTILNPTRKGYTFTGWSGSNGTTPQATVTIPKGTTGNKTFEANWKIITYKITYDNNGGVLNSTSPKTYTVEDTITIKNPTRVGYDFKGWTGSNGTTPQSNVIISKGSIGDKSYKANWTPRNDTKYVINHYLMTVDGTAYELKDTDHKEGTSDKVITVSDYQKHYNGFTYDGGKGTNKASAEKPIQLDITTTISADGSRVINLYYARNKYNLTVKPNGGTYDGKASDSVFNMFYQATKVMNKPSKKDCAFLGWTLNGTNESRISNNVFKMGYSDASLTANWSELPKFTNVYSNVVYEGQTVTYNDLLKLVKATDKDYKNGTESLNMKVNKVKYCDNSEVNVSDTFVLDTGSNKIGKLYVTYTTIDIKPSLDGITDTSQAETITVTYTREYEIRYNDLPSMTIEPYIYVYSADTTLNKNTIESFVKGYATANDKQDDIDFVPWWQKSITRQDMLNSIEVIKVMDIQVDSAYVKDNAEFANTVKSINSLQGLYSLKETAPDAFNAITSYNVVFDVKDQFGKYASGRISSSAIAKGVKPSAKDVTQSDYDRSLLIICTRDSSYNSNYQGIRYVSSKYLDTVSANSYWGDYGKNELRNIFSIREKVYADEKITPNNTYVGVYKKKNGNNVKVTINDYTK